MNPVLKSDEAVSDEVMRRLRLNTVAQGAETDVGATVHRGAQFPDVDQMPCTVLIEADPVPESRDGRVSYKSMHRYVVFGYVLCSPADPGPAAHAALRDIKRSIFRTDGKADPTWGRTVQDVQYLGREIAPRAASEKFIGVAVEFSVSFVEDLSNP